MKVRLKNDEEEEITSEPRVDSRTPTVYGPFGIQLFAWDRDVASMRELAGVQGTTIQGVRTDLNAAAGVNIYRDGFRVLPYGERGNDWLELDARRVQNPTMRVSNNQIFGYVLIGSDLNPKLRDQSNREGMIEGPALDQLRGMVIDLLTLLETRRYTLRASQRSPRTPAGGLFWDFTLSDVRDYVRRRYSDNPELIALVSQKAIDLSQRIEEVQEVLARYHRLATLGNLVDIVLHDGRSPMTKIAQSALMAKRDISRSHQFSGAAGERLTQRLEIISTQVALLGELFNRIEPFGGRRRERPALSDVERVIRAGFEVLSSECLRLKVKLDLPRSSTRWTVRPNDIQELIVNLAGNSLYWLEQVDEADRRIKVEVSRISPTELRILFADSGPGIESQFAERIFDPYFSTKPNGVGLGLTIVGSIVSDYYNGEIELLNSGPLPGATFRITLRKRE